MYTNPIAFICQYTKFLILHNYSLCEHLCSQILHMSFSFALGTDIMIAISVEASS